jgi:penicillin-insensitive murein endopeptidase
VQGKSEQEIARLVSSQLASLGSMTFGTAAHGGLLNAVHMPEDERWVLVDPPHAWGTAETVRYIVSAVTAVMDEFPKSPRLFIGDLSRREGGYLAPHLSHQSGRDVDIGYFYQSKPIWYRRATRRNLDLARTWALIRAFITRTDVRYIFMDRKVQSVLRAHAQKLGEDPDWLESIFHGSDGAPPIILHEPGHDTHFHVRFYNPVAEETGRRCYRALLKRHKLQLARYHIAHRARKGETLLGLARRYGTSVRAIMKANHLRRTLLRAGKSYLIPREAPVSASEPVALPPRRLPPLRAQPDSVASLQD